MDATTVLALKAMPCLVEGSMVYDCLGNSYKVAGHAKGIVANGKVLSFVHFCRVLASSETTLKIYEHLTGGKGNLRTFNIMTGATNHIYGTDKQGNAYISFWLPRNKSGANRCYITLDHGKDLYNIRFAKYMPSKLDEKTIKESKGMYVDKIKEIFEETTGLYTTMK